MFALYSQRGRCNENIADTGKLAVDLPTSCPRRAGVLAGINWTKCQSPRYSRGGGPWLQMTSALNEKV